MKKVVVGIQARMNSTRLPGKVLLDLGGEKIIERIYATAASTPEVAETYVLTGSSENNAVLIDFCLAKGMKILPGDDEDVLSRYERLSSLTSANILVRLTGDNPLVSSSMVSDVVRPLLSNENLQYVSNCLYQDYPLGLNVEAFASTSLPLILDKASLDEKEHVTLRFKNKKQDFRTHHVKAPPALHWPNLRLTVDEEEDYRFLERLHTVLGRQIGNTELLLDYLKSHSELITNSGVKQKNI